jgi:hypothetical protein
LVQNESKTDAATSEAFARLQSEGLDKPTSEPTPSLENQAPVQEKPQATPPSQTEVVDVKALEERIRREEQSKRDRALHEARMKWEQEQGERAKLLATQAEEKHALETMDDEDFGRYAKQRAAEAAKSQAEQFQRQQTEQQAVAIEIQRKYQAGLAKMPTAELKAQLEAMANDPTKVNSIDSFEEAVVDLLAEHKAELKTQAKLKAAQEAATRDTTAQVADLAATVTGTGLPQTSTRRQLTADENLSQGLAEALAATAKR